MKQATVLRSQAYKLAFVEGESIFAALQRSGKKNYHELRNRMVSWGICADKVLHGAQDQPTTVNQVNLLFGAVAPALQRAILGKAFDVMQRHEPPVEIGTTTSSACGVSDVIDAEPIIEKSIGCDES